MASATMALRSLAAPAAATATKTSGGMVSSFSSSFSGTPLNLPAYTALKKNSTSTSRPVKVNSMLVWKPYDNKKWETLSYLPTLSPEQILKQVDYLLRNGWVPCLEFEENAFINRTHHHSPGYYDGRYWIMWKLPMFGCNDSTQVVKEVAECVKAYPKAYVRVIGFDAVRQVQCISFIVHKPGQ